MQLGCLVRTWFLAASLRQAHPWMCSWNTQFALKTMDISCRKDGGAFLVAIAVSRLLDLDTCRCMLERFQHTVDPVTDELCNTGSSRAKRTHFDRGQTWSDTYYLLGLCSAR